MRVGRRSQLHFDTDLMPSKKIVLVVDTPVPNAQSVQLGPNHRGYRIFLLSPANITGERAKLLLRESAGFPLAQRLQSQGAPLGEVFSFISGLYFRGKLAYASAHANPPPDIPGVVDSRGRSHMRVFHGNKGR